LLFSSIWLNHLVVDHPTNLFSLNVNSDAFVLSLFYPFSLDGQTIVTVSLLSLVTNF
jgi:hypothetical protein